MLAPQEAKQLVLEKNRPALYPAADSEAQIAPDAVKNLLLDPVPRRLRTKLNQISHFSAIVHVLLI